MIKSLNFFAKFSKFFSEKFGNFWLKLEILGPSTSPVIDFDQIDIPALERGEPPTMAQLQMIEESTAIVEIREREILQITKSIVELNQLFRDVAQMVVDQGTIIDRIDYCRISKMRDFST